MGTGRTWAAVGEAYQTRLDLLNRDFSPPAWLASLAGVDGSRARIAALLERIQDRVRGTEDFVGPTTLFPVPPGRVLEAGEGDCLDRANLLTVLLAQLGLEARVALLRIAGRPDVSPDVPGISLFDHALVRVDLEEPLWVETALPPERVGELPVVCRGRRVLVVRGPGSRLLRTPGGGGGGSP